MELRNEIHSHLLSSGKLDILRVSRQIHAESLKLLYNHAFLRLKPRQPPIDELDERDQFQINFYDIRPFPTAMSDFSIYIKNFELRFRLVDLFDAAENRHLDNGPIIDFSMLGFGGNAARGICNLKLDKETDMIHSYQEEHDLLKDHIRGLGSFKIVNITITHDINKYNKPDCATKKALKEMHQTWKHLRAARSGRSIRIQENFDPVLRVNRKRQLMNYSVILYAFEPKLGPSKFRGGAIQEDAYLQFKPEEYRLARVRRENERRENERREE